MVGIKYGLAIGIGAVVASLLTGGARAIEIEAAAQTASVAGEPSAVPKAVGIAAPNALFSGLAETPVAQGSNRLENPTRQLPFYGYDGDGPMLPAPGDVQTPTHNVEAHEDRAGQEHLPGPATASTAPIPSYDYGTALPLPGPRDRQLAGLHHADQPRRRRRPPGDAARARRDVDGTAAPDVRRLDLGPVRAAAALHGRERRATAASGRPRSTSRPTVEDISGIARPGRLRGHPERLATATSASSRTSAAPTAPPTTHAKHPNSFLYRFVPDGPSRPDQGRQAAGAAGDSHAHRPADRVPRRSGGRRHPLAGHDATCTPTATTFATQLGDDPRHRGRRHARRSTPTRWRRRPAARRSSARERACSARARTFREFYFDETGDTNADTRGRRGYGGFGALFKLNKTNPASNTGTLHALLPGRQGAHRLRQRGLLSTRPRRRSSRTRATACTRSATHSTAAYLFDVGADYSRRRASRSGSSPRAATRRRRSTRLLAGTATASRTKATTRSRASTCRTAIRRSAGILGAQGSQPFQRRAGGSSTRSSTATTEENNMKEEEEVVIIFK